MKEDKLFVMDSELQNFKYRHPEYNTFTEVYDNEGDLAGYVAEITEED